MSGPSRPDWVAMADYVREHVPLDTVYGIGRGERGCCPLHGGTNPTAFQVNESGRWACFADCDARGDVISFWAAKAGDVRPGQFPRGDAFKKAVTELLALVDRKPAEFRALGAETFSARKQSKPYPPREEVEALLSEASLPMVRDEGLMLGGRIRPGIGSLAQLHGLGLHGHGLVRILPKPSDGHTRPAWAAKWRGALLPLYDERGRLISVRCRPQTAGKVKAVFPKGFCAGGMFLNRPAQALLAGDDEAKRDACTHGVVITEGGPAFLAWASKHPGPVMGLPGVAPPKSALLRIPPDAPVYLDTDPDEPGLKYARQAIQGLARHETLYWSARLAWFYERRPPERVRGAERKAALDAIKQALGEQAKRDPRLLEPDEVEGGVTVATRGFVPVDAALRGASSEPSWSELVRWGDKGIAASLRNATLILGRAENWKGVVAFNERFGQVQFRKAPPIERAPSRRSYPRELLDVDETDIANWLEEVTHTEFPISKVHAAVQSVAAESRFDPVCEYLDGLDWDGETRLEGWLVQLMGAEDLPVTRSFGSKWLISAVARAFRPGCKVDHMLVIEGPQGARKSSALAVLAGRAEWFCDKLPDLRLEKAAAEALQGPWIIEMAELDAMSKAEATTIKSFLTANQDRFRPAYGRNPITRPRRCVFVGTTNDEQYLRDATGGRRFWPVRIFKQNLPAGKIDLLQVAAARDQLWAEAVVRFRAGEPWYLDDPEVEELAECEQEARFEVDEWEGRLRDFLDDKLNQDFSGHVRVTVGECLEQLGFSDPKDWDPRHQRRVGKTLKRIGWERKRRRDGESGQMRWAYEPPDQQQYPRLVRSVGDGA